MNIDEERKYYIRNGINEYGNEATPVLKAMDDMRREYYIANTPSPSTPVPSIKTTNDLEVIWLRIQSGVTTTFNADDLWFKWQSPIYGTDRTVDDLKTLYYINN